MLRCDGGFLFGHGDSKHLRLALGARGRHQIVLGRKRDGQRGDRLWSNVDGEDVLGSHRLGNHWIHGARSAHRTCGQLHTYRRWHLDQSWWFGEHAHQVDTQFLSRFEPFGPQGLKPNKIRRAKRNAVEHRHRVRARAKVALKIDPGSQIAIQRRNRAGELRTNIRTLLLELVRHRSALFEIVEDTLGPRSLDLWPLCEIDLGVPQHIDERNSLGNAYGNQSVRFNRNEARRFRHREPPESL